MTSSHVRSRIVKVDFLQNDSHHLIEIRNTFASISLARLTQGTSDTRVCTTTVVDEDINTIVTPITPATIHTRPITRARARQLKYQVLSFHGNNSNVHENMMLPKLDTFVLLRNEGPSLEKDEHWSKNKHGDDGSREFRIIIDK